ncbi:MAG: hypothetical protein PVJ39_13845 [Gammaproteobacteria bacterium]|jgi:hypothetical protein
MNIKQKLLLITIICLLAMQPVVAATNSNITTERINGVSEFLIERANENYFYIFEKKIKDNEKFQCYFPTTYSYVSDGDLRLLLTTHEVWESAIKQDLDMLISKVAAEKIAYALNFNDLAVNISDRFISIAQYVKLKQGEREYPITFIENNTPEDIVTTVNALYTQPNKLIETLRNVDTEMGKLASIDKCGTVAKDSRKFIEDYKQYYLELQNAMTGLKDWGEMLKEQKKHFVLDEKKLKSDCKEGDQRFMCKLWQLKDNAGNDWQQRVRDELDKPIGKITAAVAGAVVVYKKVEDYKQVVQATDSNTLKALEAINLLKETGVENKVNIDELKTHVLFFAQISDAKSSEEVKSLLTQYTLPAVSFFVKREKDSHHILVTSYLGYAAGKIDNPAATGEDYQHGIIAPIGLEYSYGTSHETSLSFMVAPFDFGYPVTLKFNGRTEDLKLKDVVAPAAYFTFGVKDYPLNIGVGYQRGAKIQGVTEAEKRILLFIAFDMPLFTLY